MSDARDPKQPLRAGPWARLVFLQVPMAASAASLIAATATILDRPLQPAWYLAAFLGTWCVYLRDSAASCDAEDRVSQPGRAALFRSSPFLRRTLPAIAAVAGLATLAWIRPTTPTTALLIAVGLLGLLHAFSVGGRTTSCSTGPPRLQSRLAILKSPMVSIAWAGAAVSLPVLEGRGPGISTATWSGAAMLGLPLIAILLGDSLLLDLRDRDADAQFHLRTIAVRLRPRTVHLLVGGLLLVAAIGFVLISIAGDTAISGLALGIPAVLGLAIAWAAWSSLRNREASLTLTVMAWRFLAGIVCVTLA
jgi:hypothetical protein